MKLKNSKFANMFDKDRWQEIFSAMRSNKVRTVMTAIGVFWGIFMLVIMLGAGKGLENDVFKEMGDFATNSFFVGTRRTTMPYKGLPRGRWFSFKNDDMKILKQRIPELEVVAPRVDGWGEQEGNNAMRGKQAGAFSIMGIHQDFVKIDPITTVHGRFLNKTDIENFRKVVVIGQRVFEVLFEKDENPIGEYIRIKGSYFQVIGVFKSKHTGGWGDWQNQSIFMPYNTLQRVYNLGDQVWNLGFLAKDGQTVAPLLEKVKEILKQRHNIHPEDDRAMWVDNNEEEFKQLHGLFLGIRVLIWIVGIGTLTAGMIGVSNIMLIVVKERTHEIGIKRAIGATPMNVTIQIMTEAVILTSVAGFLGLALGVALLDLIDTMLPEVDGFQHPSVELNVAVSALIILIFSGALAGFIPARRAVSIKPIDALRDEK